MSNIIKIVFKQNFKSIKAGTEYLFDGNLNILSGINGAGKSQLLESIKTNITDVFINDSKVSKNNILKYSFRDNILLPSFGLYNHDTTHQTTSVVLSIYRTFLNFYKSRYNVVESIENIIKGELFHNFERYCDDHATFTISIKQNNNSTVGKRVSNSSVFQVISNILEKHPHSFLDLSNEDVLNSLPSDFVIKLENDEIAGITRVFTEAARLRVLERARCGDVGEQFDNDSWLKKAPWTEINNLFEKLNFNYRFSPDFEYEIPYLREEPKLYAFENGSINKREIRNINDLSDGEKAILKLIIASYDRKDDMATKILLLDEYDATLNPSLISDFYLTIQEFYLNRGIVVILSTHSPTTISLAPSEAKYYEIFRQNASSPIIKNVLREEYEELSVLESYYKKIKNPALRLEELEGENHKLKAVLNELTKPLVITEGMTDWKHIKNAKNKLGNVDQYDFYESTSDMGETAALNMLKVQSQISNSNKRIFIFDNDNSSIVKEVTDPDKNYKSWGNNVYSFAIPKPGIRVNEDNISIEHYYEDDILKKEIVCEDGITRRIYCGNDFQTTGISVPLHKRCNKKGVCGESFIRVLSGADQEKVYDLDNESNESTNYALSKDDFFELIVKTSDIDLSKFNLILDIIKEIVEDE